MRAWLRLYVESLDDPKIQKLSSKNFKFLINSWCLSAKFDGVIPSISDFAFGLRLKEKRATEIMNLFLAAELFDRKNNGFTPHNWDGRQYESDSSTVRVKRFRERFKEDSGNASDQIRYRPDTDQNNKKENEQRKNDCGSGCPDDIPFTAPYKESQTKLDQERKEPIGKKQKNGRGSSRFPEDSVALTAISNPKTLVRRALLEKPEGVSEQTWRDFELQRRAKRAPITKTALDGYQREADKAGLSLEEALQTSLRRGWQGFEAAWLKDSRKNNGSKMDQLCANTRQTLEAIERGEI